MTKVKFLWPLSNVYNWLLLQLRYMLTPFQSLGKHCDGQFDKAEVIPNIHKWDPRIIREITQIINYWEFFSRSFTTLVVEKTSFITSSHYHTVTKASYIASFWYHMIAKTHPSSLVLNISYHLSSWPLVLKKKKSFHHLISFTMWSPPIGSSNHSFM
jgi:hypothetical protein